MDRFVFYSGSKEVAPGKGANEKVSKPYPELAARHPNFREILSNFHVSPFMYKETLFYSIEHAFHAEKAFLCGRPDIVESLIEADTHPRDAKSSTSRKNMAMDADQIAQWNAISREVMKDIARAKYSQCREAYEVLMATGDAELWHFIARAKTGKNLDHFTHLEELRDEFRSTF